MIHYYSFKNFQSFKSDTAVSFELSNHSPTLGWETIAKSGQRLSTAMAVMGANGSGKTALLKPLVFAIYFMRSSFHAKPEENISVLPYAGQEDEPTEIEIVAEDSQGVLWKYQLKLTRERVLYEALYQKKIRYNYVFIREWDGLAYSVKLKNFGLNKDEAMKVRPNASLISTALQYGANVFQQNIDYEYVTNIDIFGKEIFTTANVLLRASKRYYDDPSLKNSMVELLSQWDLGLSDVDLQVHENVRSDKSTEKLYLPFGLHEDDTGNSFTLPMYLESSGTQSAFVLLSQLLPVLENGGLAVIDEIENDLHPHMVEPLLELFADSTTNPNNAQILFTCHSPEVLDFLQKSQVTFVEKNQCISESYRGDEIIGLRSDDNLRAKYMAGAMGAVPRL